MSEIKELLEKLNNTADVQSLFPDAKPQTREEEINIYADVAEKLGYSISKEELENYIEKIENEIREATASQIDSIKKLDVSELDTVAGGSEYFKELCEYTYKDYENCWYQDACDHVQNDYNWYFCNYSHAVPCKENLFEK